jgi:hypothetical protein
VAELADEPRVAAECVAALVRQAIDVDLVERKRNRDRPLSAEAEDGATQPARISIRVIEALERTREPWSWTLVAVFSDEPAAVIPPFDFLTVDLPALWGASATQDTKPVQDAFARAAAAMTRTHEALNRAMQAAEQAPVEREPPRDQLHRVIRLVEELGQEVRDLRDRRDRAEPSRGDA